jgi:trigger factor
MSDLKIEITEVDSCTKKLDIELPYPQYREELNKAYRALNRKVKVPGFRQGKTPLKILESHHKDQVEAEVLQKLVSRSYQEAVAREDLNAVGPPRLEDFSVEEGQPVKLMLTVEVKPEMREVIYEGFEFKKVVKEVTPEDLDREIEALRDRFAELVEKPDGPIADGDYITIDYQPHIEGRAVPGEKRENHTVVVGNGSLEEDFERQLLRMSKGEEGKITVRYPHDHGREDLAGREVVFQVKVREVKTKSLPPLDDDFARQAGDYETLEELKAEVKTRLEEYEKRQADHRLKNDVVSRLVEANSIDAPPSMVEEEIDLRLMHMQNQLQMQGLRLNLSEKELQEWRQNSRAEAVKQVKANLILEKIAQLKNIDLSENELEEELKKMRQGETNDLESLKKKMEENGTLTRLRESLIREKALNNIMENYNIETVIEESNQNRKLESDHNEALQEEAE